jgi:hypothetical protein
VKKETTMKRMLINGFFAAIAACSGWSVAAEPATAESAVRQALMAEFDKPDARLQVPVVAVAGDAAVASWAQGERGGRALLFRKGQAWRIALCAGDGLKGTQLLRDAGVAPGAAQSLSKSLADAESRLPASQRAKFSSFDGLVRMDAAGRHPPAAASHVRH